MESGATTRENVSGVEIKLPFSKNVTVASNELFLRTTINRNLEKLLANDRYLFDKVSSFGTGDEFSIQLYRKTKTYNRGDAIVYIEYEDDDKTSIREIYILQSIIDDNDNEPRYTYVDTYIKDFSGSGWKEPNSYFSLYNEKDPERSISAFIENTIFTKFHLSHELDLDYHPYGEIDSGTLSSRILMKDMSNIADFRDKLFYPYEVTNVQDHNFSGICKKWGNGILEYDLTFCLGDDLDRVQVIGETGLIRTQDFLRLNSLVPLSDENFNNDDYFLEPNDYFIFNKTGSSRQYIVNGVPQTNATDQLNEYHGTIEFPIPFADTNYMIFFSEYCRDLSGHVQSPNTMSFLNRKRDSITVVYLIPNYNGVSDSEEFLLKRNVFQCQIIGRWKNRDGTVSDSMES